MKRKTLVLNLAFIVALLGTSACSTLRKPEPMASHPAPEPHPVAARTSDSTALQGTWKGQEIGGDSEGPCYLIISGQDFEFRGADTNEWYKGTFSLREDTNPRQLVGAITACPAPDFVGKKSSTIYLIDNGTLTLTAHAPGNPDFPSGFDADDTRRFRFRKQ